MKRILWYEMFFDNSVIGNLFIHVRNILYCSFIVSIGSYINDYPPDIIPETAYTPYLGYPLMIIGVFLFILNLMNATSLIMKHHYGIFVKIFLIMINTILLKAISIIGPLRFYMKLFAMNPITTTNCPLCTTERLRGSHGTAMTGRSCTGTGRMSRR